MFAADAMGLWNFNRRLLIMKELLPYTTKLMKKSYPAHGPSIWQNAAFAAPAASFLPVIRLRPCRRAYAAEMNCNLDERSFKWPRL